MTAGAVSAAEDARCTAMMAQDIEVLDRLLDDGLVWIHSSAMVEGKAAFLDRIAAGSDRYLAIRRTDETIRLVGSVAIVSGVADMEAFVDGLAKSVRNRFTNVWRLDKGGPRLLSCQSTKIL